MNCGDAVVEFLDTQQAKKIGKYILNRMGFRREDAKDILQNAYISAWKNRDRFSSDKGSLVTWFGTIVRRKAIDWIRCNPRKNFFEVDEGIPSPPTNEEVNVRLANELISRPTEGEMFELYARGVPYRGLAVIFGVPIGTIKSSISRFRKQIVGEYPHTLLKE